MSRLILRYLIPVMLLASGASIVYILFSAASNLDGQAPFQRYAKGSLEKLDFTFAGTVPERTPFTGPEDQPLSLDRFKGQIILVNFWATWCAPCEREMPSLGALQTALGGDAFQIIAVSVDDDEDRAYARTQLSRWTGGTLDFYHTSEYALTYAVGIRGFPTTILYGADGAEIARFAGELDWSSLEAVGFIRAVIEAG